MRSQINRRKQSTILINDGGSFTLPGNFRVSVHILGKNDAKDDMDSQSLAMYYQDEHSILLRRSRSKKNRKADLEHELQHCCVDWVDHFIRKSYVVPRRHKKSG